MNQLDGPRIIPNRNYLFLKATKEYFGNKKITIAIGANKNDYYDYIDCRKEVLNFYASELDINLYLPLVELSKKEIINQLSDLHFTTSANKQIKFPLNIPWSCYEPINGLPCNICNSCIEKTTTKQTEIK